MVQFKKFVQFPGRILILGFGAVGQGVLPLILRHFDLDPKKVAIVTADDFGREIAAEYGVKFVVTPVTKENYLKIFSEYLPSKGDFLVNVSFNVDSVDAMEWCQKQGVHYIDACIEPWPGGHTDLSISPALRSNYALRERALEVRAKYPKGPSGVLMHGANPGLVSHFVKQALLNLAQDTGLKVAKPTTRKEWAELARQLEVKVIHVAERDTQHSSKRKKRDEFVNTWSSEAFTGESLQPAELGWGSHEKHFPKDGKKFGFGCDAAIYIDQPGAVTKVRSWTPMEGSYQGFLISHGEATSIPDYFTLKEGDKVIYRPTCHYAYHPSDDAVLSMDEFIGHGFQMQSQKRLLRDEIEDGIDELGVLLMGHKKGAYWYGSQLSIHEARKLCPHHNATVLQVTMPMVAAMVWSLNHPQEGLVEPDELPFEEILELCLPYLGKVVGVYSNWTPIQGRGKLFVEDVDTSDPWQFKNFRIS